MQCCGSGLFLKNKYGVGYTLTLAKKQQNTDTIKTYIESICPSAKLMQEGQSEITFQIPSSSSLTQFFAQLDTNLHKIGAHSYGVGITTLEEVFLRIGHGEE